MLILAMLFFQTPFSIDRWEEVTKTHYEIKNFVKTRCGDIVTTSFVGSLKILKNPELENEFVFLVSKYPPLTFVPPSLCVKEGSQDEVVVAENYFQKIKEEKLKERIALADKILIIEWKQAIDNRTGEKILEGTIKTWLLKSNGEWIFEESEEPTTKMELLSDDGTLIGFKFSLGENYHILRFDQNQLGSTQ